MKRNGFAAACAGVLLCAVPLAAQANKAKATNVPEIPYDSVPNLLKLPANLYMGEAMGVATNSKGHVFVFTRSATTRLFEFDQNGNYVKEWGEGNYGFEFAHSVRVDPQDNVWAVDEGTNMVIKFNPQGKIVMVIGHRPEVVAGMLSTTPSGPTPPAEKYTLARPTDVAWDAQGNIFISDGYVNNRVVKYDKNGHFLKQIGSEKAGSAPGQFNLPHGIAVDAQGTVYVADRSNHRMEVLTNDLEQKAIYDNIGDSWTVCVSRARISTCLRPIPIPTGTLPAPGTSAAKFTRWSSTGPSWENSATPEKSWADSRWCT